MNNVPLGGATADCHSAASLPLALRESAAVPTDLHPRLGSAAISVLHKSFWRGTEGSNPSPSSRESVSRRSLPSWVKNPGFPRGCARLRSLCGRQRAAGPANIAPTRSNISVGPYSSTAFLAMRSRQVIGVKVARPVPKPGRLPRGSEMPVDLASWDRAQAKPSAVR
jgi:hypothetical protein